MATKYHQGFFNPKNPQKWINPKNIVYRSHWEFVVMKFLDTNPEVTRVASEEMSICYLDPVQARIRRYFPDLVLQVTKDGKKSVIVLEIKPFDQTMPPKPGKGKQKRTMLKEGALYATNKAKWEAAERFCQDKGFTFKIITEKDIFGKE